MSTHPLSLTRFSLSALLCLIALFSTVSAQNPSPSGTQQKDKFRQVEYVLQITAIDRLSKTTASQRASFEIE